MRFRLRSKPKPFMPETYDAYVEVFDECLAQLAIASETPRHYLLPLKGGGGQGDARGHSKFDCDSSAFHLRFQRHALSTHHDWTDTYRARLLAERSRWLLAGDTVVITDTTTHAGA